MRQNFLSIMLLTNFVVVASLDAIRGANTPRQRSYTPSAAGAVIDEPNNMEDPFYAEENDPFEGPYENPGAGREEGYTEERMQAPGARVVRQTPESDRSTFKQFPLAYAIQNRGVLEDFVSVPFLSSRIHALLEKIDTKSKSKSRKPELLTPEDARTIHILIRTKDILTHHELHQPVPYEGWHWRMGPKVPPVRGEGWNPRWGHGPEVPPRGWKGWNRNLPSGQLVRPESLASVSLKEVARYRNVIADFASVPFLKGIVANIDKQVNSYLKTKKDSELRGVEAQICMLIEHLELAADCYSKESFGLMSQFAYFGMARPWPVTETRNILEEFASVSFIKEISADIMHDSSPIYGMENGTRVKAGNHILLLLSELKRVASQKVAPSKPIAGRVAEPTKRQGVRLPKGAVAKSQNSSLQKKINALTMQINNLQDQVLEYDPNSPIQKKINALTAELEPLLEQESRSMPVASYHSPEPA